MKLFINPELDQLEVSLAVALEYGASFEYTDFTHPLALAHEAVADELMAQYCEMPMPAGSILHGACHDINICSVDDDIAELSRNRILASFAIARKMNAAAVVVHSGVNPRERSETSEKRWLEYTSEFFAQILQDNPDIGLYVENVLDYSPALLEKLAKQLCSFENFGICLDYAHASLSETSADLWVHKLRNYIRHVDISDNNLRYDEHLPLGGGRIDWARFDTLRAAYFPQTPILLEMASEEAVRSSIEYMSRRNWFDY